MGVNRSAAVSSKVTGNLSSTCAVIGEGERPREWQLCGPAREETGPGNTDAGVPWTWNRKLRAAYGHHDTVMVKDPVFLFSSHHCAIFAVIL